MQENNFEKQVQEKMDDLRIDPSGELWQKVSSRIGSKKRDHRVLETRRQLPDEFGELFRFQVDNGVLIRHRMQRHFSKNHFGAVALIFL